MPIPTKFDGQMAEVDNLAAIVSVALRNLRHPGGDPDRLRDTLQAYINHVTETANGILKSK